MPGRPLTFGVIGVDHNHIFSMVVGMTEAGATFKGWWTKEDPLLPTRGTLIPEVTRDVFPGIPRVADKRQLLEDPSVDIILLGAMFTDRVAFAIEAMRHGKDVMVDKPGLLTLPELAQIRQAVAETGRMWSVDWSERYHVRAAVKAAELVEQGVIGCVVQTLGLGPHRPDPAKRPDWWFHADQHGGIMCYLGSHQIDHFLFFTGSTSAEIVSSTVGNFRYPQYPEVEDFGDLVLHGNGGLGYIRVDWYSPDYQPHPGDNRLIIAGTEGQIEIRKYVDVGGQPGGNHLFLMTNQRSEHIDCSNVPLTYFSAFCDDVRNRTETAATQEHSFVVSDLAIKAGSQARRMGNLAK